MYVQYLLDTIGQSIMIPGLLPQIGKAALFSLFKYVFVFCFLSDSQ